MDDYCLPGKVVMFLALLKPAISAKWRNMRDPFGGSSPKKKPGTFVPGFYFVAEGGFEPPTFGL